MWIWDVASGKLIHKLNWRSGMPTRDSFTADGRHFVCGRDRAVRMYRVADLDGSDSTAAQRAAPRKKR
jgi:hypothetical protein